MMDDECRVEAMLGQVMRYRPRALSELTTATRFSRSEIKHIYRGFKQECPMGTVDEDTFKHLFAQFYPFGDATKYAQFVFATIKSPGSNIITFEEFLTSLSTVARGSVSDKVRWMFAVYDTDRDGRVTRSDLLAVVTSVYDMLNEYDEPLPVNKIDTRVDDILQKMDYNQDGVITLDEMQKWCSHEEISKSLEAFNTVW